MSETSKNNVKKTAVIFPGVGYTKDRPLLYYAGKTAVSCGYQLVHIDFSGLDWSKEKLIDRDFLLRTLDKCLQMAEKQLEGYGDLAKHEVIFISKSIGTVVAAAYEQKMGLEVKQICFSPLAFIGDYIRKSGGVLFYGDDDPFADRNDIERVAEEKELATYRIEGGNHSLETGDVYRDIENLRGIMKQVEEEIG